jgi:hypothetical protein
LGKYRTQAAQLTAKELTTWLASVSKSKNSKLGQIFNCVETRQYLETLEQLSPHFMIDSINGIPFCMDFMHGVNGGVSVFVGGCDG